MAGLVRWADALGAAIVPCAITVPGMFIAASTLIALAALTATRLHVRGDALGCAPCVDAGGTFCISHRSFRTSARASLASCFLIHPFAWRPFFLVDALHSLAKKRARAGTRAPVGHPSGTRRAAFRG